MGGEGVDDLLSAVQQGHVTMTRRAPAASGAKARGGRRAGGDCAGGLPAGDGGAGGVRRRSGPHDADRRREGQRYGQCAVGNQVALDRASGDAHAAGAVKVNYLAQASGNKPSGLRGTAPGATPPGNSAPPSTPVEPTHVVAASADMVRATQVTTFYGKPARLWQAGSQVQAPVIQLQGSSRAGRGGYRN